MRSTSWLWGREGELPTSHQLSLERRILEHSCPTAHLHPYVSVPGLGVTVLVLTFPGPLP